MRKFMYTFITAILLLSSCKSIDKMMDKGEYEKAYRYGIDKLQGEKNKKTKYVKALEKAFHKMNKKDLKYIDQLKARDRSNAYDQIVKVYDKMERRQEYIAPLLPLISEDGYYANIELVNYTNDIAENINLAIDRHYKRGLDLLDASEKEGNKGKAIGAYNAFEDVLFYKEYRDVHSLKSKAYELGQKHILIESYSHGSNIAFDHTLEILNNTGVSQLNTKWRKFHTTTPIDKDISHVATLEILEIIPGRERERINEYTETKEIIDGQIPILDQKGREVTDTLGNTLYTDRIIIAQAHVLEVLRNKEALMKGRVVIIDNKNGTLRSSVPIEVTHVFDDYSCNYKGDKRALTEKTRNRIKRNCLPFPDDYTITTDLAYAYQEAAIETLRNERY